MEDGITILYEVFNNGNKCGELKVLSLGITQIVTTCEKWEWDVEDYEIRRISDSVTVWRGTDQ